MFFRVMDETPRYGPEELADRAGVSRRTVRYYVQRGLLPAPLGVGRGAHYTEEHLARLLRIRELADAGVPLEEMGDQLDGREPARAEPAPLAQSAWTRVTLSEDVELHVRGRRLSDAQLRTLCQLVKRTIGGTE